MTDDSELSAVEALARLSFAIGARLEIRSAEVGLSVQQVRLLGILRDREPTINELAAHLGVDKSSMSGAVARAERRGLVSRTTDTHDGRAVRVHLETAGRALVDAASTRFADDARVLLDALSERQRAQWTMLTTRLLAAGAKADW
ncbi:MarR family winged helix-turn-helix transcriptional regulator [Nocardioides sp. NPDC087217]|uniref:MarR family winged helix-turn-helix transcriptional regulator n=1 Tax=Nocardioides sp. NPDC087217 TaxID=3364335 RepID=UPI003820E769